MLESGGRIVLAALAKTSWSFSPGADQTASGRYLETSPVTYSAVGRSNASGKADTAT
jgi:hypothetical protein